MPCSLLATWQLLPQQLPPASHACQLTAWPPEVTYAYLWKGQQLLKMLLTAVKGMHDALCESSTATTAGVSSLLQWHTE